MQRVDVCGDLGQESTLVDTTLRYLSTVRIPADLLWSLEEDLPGTIAIPRTATLSPRSILKSDTKKKRRVSSSSS
jgi:hypothetical protein